MRAVDAIPKLPRREAFADVLRFTILAEKVK